MINTLKVLFGTASLALVLSASSETIYDINNKQLIIDETYACMWWPTCRDPDDMKPMPTDSSAPKPTGDKDTTKDKKDEAQLA